MQPLKPVIPAFCVSEKLSDIHIQMLSLVPVIYPVVLAMISCLLVELHARNNRAVGIVWKPFSFILKKTNVTVTSNTVFHALATLTFLSVYTVMYNGIALVGGSAVHKSSDCSEYKEVLFTDPTITWLSGEHILYIGLMLIPFTVLVLFPSFLLLLYLQILFTVFEC